MNILLVHCHYRLPGGEDAVFAAERALLERHGHRVVVYERSTEEAAHGMATRSSSTSAAMRKLPTAWPNCCCRCAPSGTAPPPAMCPT